MRYGLQYQDRCDHELTMTNGVQNITCSTDYVSTLQSTATSINHGGDVWVELARHYNCVVKHCPEISKCVYWKSIFVCNSIKMSTMIIPLPSINNTLNLFKLLDGADFYGIRPICFPKYKIPKQSLLSKEAAHNLYYCM